jgi:hypothetical protein
MKLPAEESNCLARCLANPASREIMERVGEKPQSEKGRKNKMMEAVI